MTENGRATVRSRQVAGELRRLRKAVGLTTGEVGTRLGVSQSKISRIENSQLGLNLEEVAAMLGLYQVRAERREELLDLLRKAAEPGWVRVHGGGLPDTWQALIDWENKATVLRNYEPLMLPGLLQTADYARAIISGTAERKLSETELDTKVAARLGRQGMLSRALPPSLHVLLAEPALRMPVGSSAIMAVQLRHLTEVAQRRWVTVQVVPFSAGPHPGLQGSFLLMDFEADPSLVHVENSVQSIFIEEASHIALYTLAWERILARALPPQRSAELIASMAAKMDRPSEEQT